MFRWILMGTMALAMFGCDDDGQTAGNATNCESGDNCTNNCDDGTTGCSMNCSGTAVCAATCQAGQDCSFTCNDSAQCDFNCNAGTCAVQADSANCECSGNCTGTCGGLLGGGDGGSSGGDGGDDDCECGAATDPGYAACMADCF
jgi:hypothetical protein